MENKESTPQAQEQQPISSENKTYMSFSTEAEFNSYIQDLQSKSDSQKQFEKLKSENEKMKNEFEKLKNEKSEIEKTFSTFQKQTVFEKKIQPFTSKIRKDIPKTLVDTYLEKIRNEALASDDLEKFDLESRFKDILQIEPNGEKTKGTGVAPEKPVVAGFENVKDAKELYEQLAKQNPELLGSKEFYLKLQAKRKELQV